MRSDGGDIPAYGTEKVVTSGSLHRSTSRVSFFDVAKLLRLGALATSCFDAKVPA
jgi:hypothetical protein